MLIKICGVRTPEMAAYAASCGATHIGIVFCPDSKRVVDLSQAKLIAAAAKQAGAKPVGVFRNMAAEMLTHICSEIQLEGVQLHGKQTHALHVVLPENVCRVFAFSSQEVLNVPAGAFPTRDILLIDAPHAGMGQPFNWSEFHYSGPYPWFLAGGLTVENVTKALKLLHPIGVDVSSGVEDETGEKSQEKIKAFIERVLG